MLKDGTVREFMHLLESPPPPLPTDCLLIQEADTAAERSGGEAALDVEGVLNGYMMVGGLGWAYSVGGVGWSSALVVAWNLSAPIRAPTHPTLVQTKP